MHKAKSIHGLLYGESEPRLDIVVSKAQLERALRIMDALLKALLARGFLIEVIPHAPPPPYERNMKRVEPHRAFHTEVRIAGIAVPFALREEAHWVSSADGRRFAGGNWMAGYSRGAVERVGTGVLEFTTDPGRFGYWRARWREGTRKSLDGLLGSFEVRLIRIAHEVRLEWEAGERRRQEEAERKRLKEEELKREAEEAERVRLLHGQLRDRRLAHEIRDYVAEIQAILDEAGVGHGEGSELAEQLMWVSGCADGLDPATRARKSIREGMAELHRRGDVAGAREVR